MKNDTWIDLVTNCDEDIRHEVLAELLPLAEDAVRLDDQMPRVEGQGECEVWMVDGDHLDTVFIVLPREGMAECRPYDSHEWPEEFIQAANDAKDAYYGT
jgi:hypothetical protein